MRILVILILLWPFNCGGQTQDNFAIPDSIAHAWHGAPFHDLKLLANRLTASLDDEHLRYRAIFVWVTTNFSADYDLYKKQLELRTTDPDDTVRLRNFSKEVFQTLRVKRATLCTGYAYLIRELCRHAGIECRIIEGYGKSPASGQPPSQLPNHAWNAVHIQGKWYFSDPTWASGRIKGPSGKFVFEFSDKYFLVTPEKFIIDHYPINPHWILTKDAPTLDSFLNNK